MLSDSASRRTSAAPGRTRVVARARVAGIALAAGARVVARARVAGMALAAGVTLAATLALVPVAAAAPIPPPVTISPNPGTLDASPSTQISILGPQRRQIRSVRVIGSVSGRHTGHLRAYSGDRGASFLLAAPLTQGEHVTVTVTTAPSRVTRSRFTVARLAPVPPILDIPVLQPAKLDHFVSQPFLLPPRITVRRRAPGLRDDIFLTPLPSPVIHPESNNSLTIHPVGPGGPMIIDRRGRLVWFHQLAPPDVATNFRPQRYLGHDVLTWWQGPVSAAAFGLGEGVIASPAYRVLHIVHAGNGYRADLHEFLLTPSGDALFTVYTPVLVHLPGTPLGARSLLLDSLVQEVDVRTGLVAWEWHAYGHIPLRDSYATPATSANFDAYHLNSIQPVPGGRVLVSARDTSAVYLIDRATGRIVWTLGGKASSFRLGPGTRFYFQHDAQLIGDDQVSLFDDEAGPPVYAPASRGIRLGLDLRSRTARLLTEYRRPGRATLAQSEGSVQDLAGGGAFVGFGSTPFFSEFSASGRLVFDASLPTDDGSYREFTYPWSATPTTRPTITVRRTAPARATVYASWNGATTVARWQVLAVGVGGALHPIAEVADSGFETRIPVTGAATRFAVRALGATGRTLATSIDTSSS